MRKMIFKGGFVIVAAMMMLGCKKEDKGPDGNYSPLTAGSTWSYQVTSSSGSGAYTITATNQDTVVNGRTYKVLTNTGGNNHYRNKSGNEYWNYGTLAADVQIEQLYLKDNVGVNTSWESQQNFNITGMGSIAANLKYTVLEKGVARTVNGVNFPDVIRVGLVVSVIGIPGNVVTANIYSAAGVGIIETDYSVRNLSLAGIPDSDTKEILVSYSIK